MKKIIILFIALISYSSYSQFGNRNQGNRQNQRQRQMPQTPREPPKFKYEVEKFLGIVIYDIDLYVCIHMRVRYCITRLMMTHSG